MMSASACASPVSGIPPAALACDWPREAADLSLIGASGSDDERLLRAAELGRLDAPDNSDV